MSVTVVIASIPPRFVGRKRAINSVLEQTMPPQNVLVNIDVGKQGAAATRDLLINSVKTKYICILDDDDWLLPNHIEVLYNAAERHQADLVYPWHRTSNGTITHLEQWRGIPWRDDDMHQVPITWMAKTESLRSVGGFSEGFDALSDELDETGNRVGEDYLMLKKMVAAGMRIVHVNEETWVWSMDGGSTHGRPDRW